MNLKGNHTLRHGCQMCIFQRSSQKFESDGPKLSE